jgi:hypothetical protein
MNALNHEFEGSTQVPFPAQLTPAPSAYADNAHQDQAAHALSGSWAALHDAANAVAQLAQLAPAQGDEETRSLPARAQQLPQDARRAVEAGVDDLALVMRTGLTALLSATSAGKDTSAAALTLWLEFHAGRRAILSVADPLRAEGPA